MRGIGTYHIFACEVWGGKTRGWMGASLLWPKYWGWSSNPRAPQSRRLRI